MSAPEPGSPAWQDQLNREVAEHDRKARESGRDGQTFEISQGAK